MRLKPWWPLAGLTLAAAAVRWATIDVQSMWYDEALTVQLLKLPLGHMLSVLPDRELTPPFYYIIGWGWVKAFGASQLAVRSLSALLGTATVPVAYAIARRVISSRAALAAAALTAFSPLLVWYSQESRPYALLVLLGAMSLGLFARARERPSPRALAAWALVSALAILTHYFAAFLVLPEAVLLMAGPARRRALAATAAVGAVGLSLIPLAVHEQRAIGIHYISAVPLSERLYTVPENFMTGFVIGFHTPGELVLDAIAAPLTILGVVLALRRTAGRERRGARLAGVCGLAAIGLPAALALLGADYMNQRNVLVAWLPLCLLVAAGFGARATRPRVGAAATVALCAVGVAAVVITARDPDLHREDWRGIAAALGPPGTPRRAVVVPVSGVVGLDSYLPRLSPLGESGAMVTELDIATPRNARLQGSTGGRPRVIDVPAPGFRLVERRYAPTYTLLRFQSPAPVLISGRAAALSARRLVAAPAVLIQR